MNKEVVTLPRQVKGGAGQRVGVRRHRAGFVMAFVLVMVTLLSILMVSMLGQFALAQKQLQVEFTRLETERLADAGIDRCHAHWQLDTNYRGETWSISPEESGWRYGAEVVITVVPTADGSRTDVITVEARLAPGTKHSSTVERTLRWSRP